MDRAYKYYVALLVKPLSDIYVQLRNFLIPLVHTEEKKETSYLNLHNPIIHRVYSPLHYWENIQYNRKL